MGVRTKPGAGPWRALRSKEEHAVQGMVRFREEKQGPGNQGLLGPYSHLSPLWLLMAENGEKGLWQHWEGDGRSPGGEGAGAVLAVGRGLPEEMWVSAGREARNRGRECGCELSPSPSVPSPHRGSQGTPGIPPCSWDLSPQSGPRRTRNPCVQVKL